MNGSKDSRSGSRVSKPLDALDRMRSAIEDGKKATELLKYSEDFDEPTGRHEVTVNLHQPGHPSQPELVAKVSMPVPARAAVGILGAVKGWPQAIAALAAAALAAWWLWLRSR